MCTCFFASSVDPSTSCMQKFDTFEGLDAHAREEHVAIDQQAGGYVCSWLGCAKVIKQKGPMAVHITTHSLARPHWCVPCRKGFTTLDNLKRHNESAHGDRAVTCAHPRCRKSFKSAEKLSKSNPCPLFYGIFTDIFQRHTSVHTMVTSLTSVGGAPSALETTPTAINTRRSVARDPHTWSCHHQWQRHSNSSPSSSARPPGLNPRSRKQSRPTPSWRKP